MVVMTYKPRLLVDFDGVIHGYSQGWLDGSAYDSPKEGAKDALQTLTDKGYEVVIFSTRSSGQIYEWLRVWSFPRYRVTNEKEPAVALINDRAIRFQDWHQALGDVQLYYPNRGLS
jgi:hypothetical protein